jgi:two-component system OmpR family sensor kinase
VTIRRRLVIVAVAAFVLVLVAAGAGAMGLLRNRLVNDLDEALLDRRASVEGLAGLVSTELLRDLAAQRPQIGGADVAIVSLASDGSVSVALPSGPPEEPDPLPILSTSDIRQLRAGEEPFTVDGGSDGYRATATVLDDADITLVIAQPLDDVARTMRQVLFVLVIVGAGAAAVLGGAIWLLIRRELQPLDEMAATADHITEGDLSKRVAIDRPSNEVGRLGGALNSMLGRIEDAVAAKTESEDTMRRFVADASHELRTPLTSIRGYAELYRAGADSPDHVARSFERIEQEATRMGGLVEDLVLLARLDQERPFAKQDVDLAEVVREAVTDAQAIEPDRPVTVAVGNGRMVIDGDAERLRQVVANLLGNVRTHTEPGTTAKVSVNRDRDSVVVAVADEGQGMDPDMAAQVFERFYQASPDRTTPGSGLGLSIVRSIVERHAGTVEIESALAAGTTVTLRIPAGSRSDKKQS